MSKYIWSAVVIAAVLAGQFTGIRTAYMFSPAYDYIMHILGGFGFGLLAGALFDRSAISYRKKVLIIISTALTAGLLWEYVEIAFEITGRQLWSAEYFADTAKDIINDIIGGALAVLFIGRPHDITQNE